MPMFDGTGPQGNGPKSGRGMGRCMQRGNRQSCRQNFRGFGCRFAKEPLSQEKYLEALKESKKRIETEIAELEKELSV